MAGISITQTSKPNLWSLQQNYSANHTFSLEHKQVIKKIVQALYFNFTLLIKRVYDVEYYIDYLYT